MTSPTPIPILCYHAVSVDTGGPLAPWVMDPGCFEEHLDALAGAGYRAVALTELLDRVHDRAEAPATGTVVLTFDDGYADLHDEVAPRLAARDWPATAFVSSGLVGGDFHDRPMLTPAQLPALGGARIEVGAHSDRHVELDAVAPGVARAEIQTSRDRLAAWTGRAVDTFAYPHGYHDDGVRDLVVAAGFRGACAVKQALSSTADDRFALARLMLRGDVDAEDLLARLTDEQTPVAIGGRERPRTTAWRVVRRARALARSPWAA